MSRSTLNLHLNTLEDRGLIRREQRRNEDTRKQLNTRYKLAFEDDFEPVNTEIPCPKFGH
ncbi:putative transcriptional regulator [Labrenzia sp. EL_159]|nr:putative transcriptional regulator [Labrenzia sp. EL_162]MBG6196611.1 putative transcriptional regulator [Labrenzia sp. EL_159]